MSGALNSVFGGGNIFGALLSIASISFPPMAIASSLTNLLTQTLGAALKTGIDMLMQQAGLPRFLGNMIKEIIENTVSANQQPSTPEVDSAVSNQAGQQAQAWGTDFAQQFVNNTMDRLSSSGSSKKPTAGSWLEAIALAMADAMSSKAGRMIDLSDEIKTLSSKTIDQNDTNAQKKNAGELQVANARLNAAGKEFELLTNTMKSVVDSIGNSLAQAARKG